MLKTLSKFKKQDLRKGNSRFTDANLQSTDVKIKTKCQRFEQEVSLRKLLRINSFLFIYSLHTFNEEWLKSFSVNYAVHRDKS